MRAMKRLKIIAKQYPDEGIVKAAALSSIFLMYLSILLIGYNLTTGKLDTLTLLSTSLVSIASILSITILLSRLKWDKLLPVKIFAVLVLLVLLFINSFVSYELLVNGRLVCLC